MFECEEVTAEGVWKGAGECVWWQRKIKKEKGKSQGNGESPD